MSVCLSVRLSDYQLVFLSLYVCLSVWMCVCLFFWAILFVCIHFSSLSLSLSIHPSIDMHTHSQNPTQYSRVTVPIPFCSDVNNACCENCHIIASGSAHVCMRHESGNRQCLENVLCSGDKDCPMKRNHVEPWTICGKE